MVHSSRREPLLSPKLEPGDLVRFVSPASYPDDESDLPGLISLVEGWGMRADVGRHALDRWGYMAGTDSDRLVDLNEAFRDPSVRAVIAIRGGAGAYRIADGLDFEAVLADPKPLLGFSDICYLHLALARRCGLATLHGCLVGPTAQATGRQLLMSTEPVVLRRDPGAVSAVLDVPGVVSGRLLGGNLTTLATSVGVRLPDLDGAILFLEDQRVVGLGTLDRQLTQLLSSRALDGVVGIALGSFEGFKGYSDRGWTFTEVVEDRLGGLGVPVLGGLFAGHDCTTPEGEWDQSVLPLGTIAFLDTAAGTLTIAPAVY